MASWADTHNLKLVNTFYRKTEDKLYTYTSNQAMEKQLDYILVDKFIFRKVCDVEAGNLLDLGSDHRSLMCRLRNRNCRKRQKAKKKNSDRPVPDWPPDDRALYDSHLQHAFAQGLEGDLRTKCEKIEKELGAAMIAAAASKTDEASNKLASHVLAQLLPSHVLRMIFEV